ncbi:quinone oxidoreductase family protein [Gordonia rhizosphera]|uniref:Putative oxidoreductase n=1 Tax=Gordonia rhizosphera NBRC 16068 TaxID=1108045 RepID=K6X254_9ACTN|nr:NADP-dependent oxidoreductase [Gordonia rhizosphera]GAB92859.1 putative oxidoreductase [Gordonia rhizosphera NBRC 16068]
MAYRVVATTYGDPVDVLEVVEVTVDDPGPGEVIVENRAIGMNPADVKAVRGLMGRNEAKLPLALGFEAAGVVTAVGADVTGLAVGDEVVVYPAAGCYCETMAVKASAVHRKPASLDFPHAAGLLLAGVTAADAVATAEVTDADTVLVHGGSGAVGTIAIQLARTVGATVIATASPANHEHLRSMGAVPVAYGEGLLDRVRAAASAPVTKVIDTVGNDEAIDTSLALVDDPASIVSIAAFTRTADGIVVIDGSSPSSRRHRAEAIDRLLADAGSGALVIEVAKTFALRDAPAAMNELLSAHPRGKFVLLP